MIFVVFIVNAFLLFFQFHLIKKNGNDTNLITLFSQAIINAFLFFISFSLLLTVILSLANCLSETWAKCLWILSTGILTFLNILLFRKIPSKKLFFNTNHLVSLNLTLDQVIFWFLLILLFLSTFLMGALVPPNNGDSLIYHLPRQLIWISNRTVFLDAMPYPHMSIMPPLTEWIGVQLYLLNGNDRLHFFIQWLSYLATIASIYLILEKSGASKRIQTFSILFFATLPAAFYQASNTKNDLFLTALLTIILLNIINLKQGDISQPRCAFKTGVCAGFCLLTKGTALAYLPPLFFISGIFLIKEKIRPQITAILIFGLSFFPFFIYQYKNQIFPNPSVSDYEVAQSTIKEHINEQISIKNLLAVIVKNFSYQLALPIDSYNQFIVRWVNRFCLVLGIPSNDRVTNFLGTDFTIDYNPKLEDLATSFPHFILAAISSLGIIFFMSKSSLKSIALYSIYIWLFAFTLFSLIFKWQVHHSRLLIPVIALAAPAVGIFLASLRPLFIGNVVVVALIAWLTPSFASWQRPIIGRLNIFNMPEDVGVGRAGSGAVFLPLFGKTMADAGVQSVWLDLKNGVVHAALRYLPLDTNYGFPKDKKSSEIQEFDAVLTNVPENLRSPLTSKLISEMVFISAMEGWELYVRTEIAPRAFQSNNLPPIAGLKVESGLEEWQGPYPEWKIERFAILRPEGAKLALYHQTGNATLILYKSPNFELSITDCINEIFRIPEKEECFQSSFYLNKNFRNLQIKIKKRENRNLEEQYRIQKIQFIPFHME